MPASSSPPHPPSSSQADTAKGSRCSPPESPEVSSEVFSAFSGRPLVVGMQDQTGMPSLFKAVFHRHSASESEERWAGDMEVMLPATFLSRATLFCRHAEPSPLMASTRMHWPDITLSEPGASQGWLRRKPIMPAHVGGRRGSESTARAPLQKRAQNLVQTHGPQRGRGQISPLAFCLEHSSPMPLSSVQRNKTSKQPSPRPAGLEHTYS